jgi:hypothetical protein
LRDPQRAVREAARVLAPSGRLLIVDFAPHELSFLQEQFAHERLGLAESQLGQWLSEAGLAMVERSTLAPAGPDANGKLTVKVWLAGFGQTSAAPGSRGAPRSLEQVR